MHDPKEYGKIYRERNKEKIAKKKREWVLANPDKVREYNRKQNERRRKGPKPLPTPEEIKEKITKQKERSKIYFQENRDKLQKNRTEYYRNNRLKQKLRGVKSRCKKKNLKFDLQIENIIVPDICPVLGIPLEYKNGKGPQPGSPSIDRIRPERGYVQDNVRIISNRANILKNNMTLEECKLILKDLEEIYKDG